MLPHCEPHGWNQPLLDTTLRVVSSHPSLVVSQVPRSSSVRKEGFPRRGGTAPPAKDSLSFLLPSPWVHRDFFSLHFLSVLYLQHTSTLIFDAKKNQYTRTVQYSEIHQQHFNVGSGDLTQVLPSWFEEVDVVEVQR